MPGVTPSDRHRHMASDMREDLARFAKQLGYENDLDDDDLNHALSEVAEEINAQRLRVDPKKLSSRVSSRPSSRTASQSQQLRRGSTVSRPSTASRLLQSTRKKALKLQKYNDIRIPQATKRNGGRARFSASPRTKRLLKQTQRGSPPPPVLASAVKRPQYLQKKFGLGIRPTTVSGNSRARKKKSTSSIEYDDLFSNKKSRNRVTKEMSPRKDEVVSITPKATDEKSLHDAQLKNANDSQSLIPNADKRKGKVNHTSLRGGSDPKKIQILPIGADELMKKIKTRIMQRSKRVGAVAIWLRRAFSQFDNDGNNIIDQQEFTRGIREGLGFMHVHSNDIDDLFKLLDAKKEKAIRLNQFITAFTPHGFEGTPKILQFSDKEMSDREALKQLKHDFAREIHTRNKTLRELFMQMSCDNRQGKVNRKQLTSTLNKYGIAVGNKHAIDLLFDACDLNKDGVIDYSELSKGLQIADGSRQKVIPVATVKLSDPVRIGKDKLHQLVVDAIHKLAKSTNDLKRMFRQFDKNDDETIDFEEFSQALSRSLRITGIHRQDLKDLFDSYDKEKTGNIPYPVFVESICVSKEEKQASTYTNLVEPPMSNTREKAASELTMSRQQLQIFANNERKLTANDPTLPDKIKQIKERIKHQSLLKFRNVRKFFLNMDKSRKGVFTKPEIKRAMRHMGIGHIKESALDALFDMADANKDGLVDYNEFMKYVIEAEGPKLAKWDDKCYEPLWESAEYKNLTKKEKQKIWTSAQNLVIGQFDTSKYYRSKPTPNVINGVHSADYPPWDEGDRQKTKTSMYNTTQKDHLGVAAYSVNPRNIIPSAIIPKRRPLSIPSKLELKAHTLSLAKRPT